jgi:alpha-glucosidase
MHHARRLYLVFVTTFAGPVTSAETAEKLELESPDRQLRVQVFLDVRGRPAFEAAYHEQLVATGKLGLELAGFEPLADGMELIDTERSSRDVTYAIPVGKTSKARDHHNELVLSLKEKKPPHRRLDVVFRAFDDGIAFCYRLPEENSEQLVLIEDLTSLQFAGDPAAHVLPLNSFTTSYEKHYETKRVSEIASDALLGLPLLLEAGSAAKPVWIAVTEAALADWAGMYLAADQATPGKLLAKLSPLPGRSDGAKVVTTAPCSSPWRVLMIADKLGTLLESNLVFHLNEPSAIADTSWIKPGKTTFPWWNGYVLKDVDFEPGLNTATHKHYIDFCAEHGIEYHSLDGTDTAWYGGPIVPNRPTDVTKAVPEIDLPELLRYAKEKGVRLRLWMHWRALAPQLDEALETYEKWGIEGIMVDFMDRDDQEMVRFYHELARKAAQHRLTVTLHGAYKPTGMERTWPNVLSYEAALNQEYNKWDPVGAPPRHNIDIALIRMLAGPLDYHQGGMRSVLPADFQPRNESPPVQGTRGHQLAMYVVYQNHLPMLVDYPAAYRGQQGLDFLAGVPTNWDETRVLHAEFGKCIVIARRNGDTWYVGGMAAAEPVDLELPLTFLGDGTFHADRLLDDPAQGANALVARKLTVSADETLHVTMPAAGGYVARLAPQMRSPR